MDAAPTFGSGDSSVQNSAQTSVQDTLPMKGSPRKRRSARMSTGGNKPRDSVAGDLREPEGSKASPSRSLSVELIGVKKGMSMT